MSSPGPEDTSQNNDQDLVDNEDLLLGGEKKLVVVSRCTFHEQLDGSLQ